MADLKMPDLNMVTIAGNLTNDPTFGETNDRTPVVNFHLASNRRFRDNKGQVKEDVCFVGIVAWDALARSCKKRLFKGSPVLVSGELQSRKWKSEDGHNRTIVEIKARKIQFLDRSKKPIPEEVPLSNSDDYSDNQREEIVEIIEEANESIETESSDKVAAEMSQKKEDIEVTADNDDFGFKNLEI